MDTPCCCESNICSLRMSGMHWHGVVSVTGFRFELMNSLYKCLTASRVYNDSWWSTFIWHSRNLPLRFDFGVCIGRSLSSTTAVPRPLLEAVCTILLWSWSDLWGWCCVVNVLSSPEDSRWKLAAQLWTHYLMWDGLSFLFL